MPGLADSSAISLYTHGMERLLRAPPGALRQVEEEEE